MWRLFSLDYIRRNRAACISIAVTAMIASFLISAISGIFYNMWEDENRLIAAEEGDWQGRLRGDLNAEALAVAESFDNVSRAELAADQESGEMVLSLWFENPRSVYQDTEQLARLIGGNEEAGGVSTQYHYKLLNQYLIFSPEEKENPPQLLFLYLGFLTVVCISLAMMIHSAFAVTMESRMQQLGMMKSVGATPAQIRTVLLQEAMALCLFPVLAGIPLGAGSCYWFMRMAGSLAENLGVSRAVGAVFYFPAPVVLLSLAVCLSTVWISAWLPAGRLAGLAPLEAVRGGREAAPVKMRRFRLIVGMFGIEGELARESLYARRRAFRTAGISLTLACFVFSAFLNFEVVSYLHTYHTFFERYQDTWDLLLTLDKRTEREGMAGHGLLEALRGLDGVESCAEYQKYQAHVRLPADMVSQELEALGGPLGLTDTGIVRDGRDYLAQAPLVVLDDASFREYCRESGMELEPWTGPEAGMKLEPGDDLSTGGTRIPVVAVNRIWDNLNSRYKNRQYVPYLKAEDGLELELAQVTGRAAEAGNAAKTGRAAEDESPDPAPAQDPLKARILAYSDLPPDLREEYEDFTLVLVAPESGFRNAEAAFGKADRHFNILTESDEVIDGVQAQIEGMMGSAPGWEMENRLNEEAFNEAVRTGYKLVMGILCGTLALVGLSNVFANALGSISQRKREFARYLSVGMTPGSVRKVLALEAFYVCAKPVAVSLLLNIPFVAYCLRASLLMPGEYLANLPVLPIGIFVLSIFLAVGTAYWIGGRRILRGDLVGMLRDGTQI